MTPALCLFSLALGSHGSGFNILYAVVKGTWQLLPPFWYSILRLWTDTQSSPGTSDWKRFAQTAPCCNNFHLLFGTTRRSLAKHSKYSGLLQILGRYRQQDFVNVSSTLASSAYLESILRVEDFPRPASKPRFITEVIPRLNLLVNHDSPSFGPVFPRLIESARHDWSIDGTMVADMTNRDFVRLLLSLRTGSSIPSLSLQQLGVPKFLPSSGLWILEYGLDRHVLSVATDVKFRLQHNALGLQYKFRWRTEVTTSSSCIHDCGAMETAIHLFWLCPAAKYQWNFFLAAFSRLFRWRRLVGAYFVSDFAAYASVCTMVFGNRAILIAFHVVCCCVFRYLWLHRNKRLYKPGTSINAAFVRHHCFAYVDLHLRTLRSYAERKKLARPLAPCFRYFIYFFYGYVLSFYCSYNFRLLMLGFYALHAMRSLANLHYLVMKHNFKIFVDKSVRVVRLAWLLLSIQLQRYFYLLWLPAILWILSTMWSGFYLRFGPPSRLLMFGALRQEPSRSHTEFRQESLFPHSMPKGKMPTHRHLTLIRYQAAFLKPVVIAAKKSAYMLDYSRIYRATAVAIPFSFFHFRFLSCVLRFDKAIPFKTIADFL